jgi:DNA-directed DNA polymerase III PolC
MLFQYRSYHSLRYGTISVEDLVQQAKASGIGTILLADRNTSTGVFDFVRICTQAGIKPIVGIEFWEGELTTQIVEDDTDEKNDYAKHKDLTISAGNTNRSNAKSYYAKTTDKGLASNSKTKATLNIPKHDRKPNRLLYTGIARSTKGFAQLCKFMSEHNLSKIALPQYAPTLSECFFVYPLTNLPSVLGPQEYIAVHYYELNKLYGGRYKAYYAHMVAWHTISIANQKEFNLHKILRAIDCNTLLSKLSNEDYCNTQQTVLNSTDLLQKFEHHQSLIATARQIVDSCHFDFDFKTLKNKKYYTGSKDSDKLLLESLATEGLRKRYGVLHKEAQKRVARELEVIDTLGFSAYFLITWDIIRYSNSRGFFHVGRGSGANSIVSYCLGITDICPIELNLYFERFLNPSRTSPPDFDIDWSWQERDEILNYIFKRFDTNHVAFTGTIVEFKYRSIVRELGKVFGLPKEELDILSRSESSELQSNNRVTKAIHEYGLMLRHYPNARSMHACGILISEHPMTDYTVLELPPKGFPTAQIDMHITESIGFEKFDILSQRGIGHINDSVKLIARNQNKYIDIRHEVQTYKHDALINKMLATGKTIGCFYIESPAMRGLLRRLQCSNYLTLVAASSIIRPGVAKSGMMREYVFRHNNPDSFEYFHPVFAEQLGDTYGVMVYQEDVLKIAHHFADLDLADADILRRAMSGKSRSKAEFERIRNKFFDNCIQKGYPQNLIEEVFRQIESFAGYSFCKSHSASYAVESYMSLYLKTYYPIEFMVAVINNFGGFYRTEVYVHEARMAGGNICNPCVNRGEYLTSLTQKDIYIGFVHLQNIEEKIAFLIPQDRVRYGPYLSLEDFVDRIPIGIESLQTLIYANAFRFTGKPKNELVILARMLLNKEKPQQRSGFLFHEPVKEVQLPALIRHEFEDAFDEIELFGFPLSCTPFDLLQTKQRGDIMAKDLAANGGKVVRMIAYLIARKHVPTSKGLMNFGTWVDVEGTYFDSTHFADCLTKYPFEGGGCYLLQGKVDVDFSFATIVVTRMAKLPFIPDPRFANDKDMRYAAQQNIKEDVSVTHRAPYPSEAQIGLPRSKMQ